MSATSRRLDRLERQAMLRGAAVEPEHGRFYVASGGSLSGSDEVPEPNPPGCRLPSAIFIVADRPPSEPDDDALPIADVDDDDADQIAAQQPDEAPPASEHDQTPIAQPEAPATRQAQAVRGVSSFGQLLGYPLV